MFWETSDQNCTYVCLFITIYSVRNAEYRELLEQNDGIHDENDDQRNIQMQIQQRQRRQRQENTLEAQIQPGDTLQAIALRYNCTVSFNNRLKNEKTKRKQTQCAIQMSCFENICMCTFVGKCTSPKNNIKQTNSKL